uniref:Uncharacterized protein LOC104230061 n=1 Tax=Nicotiana sylvestris TaxID=4096 RepID=A0A1U7WUW8_NICSY|nr:PREDICTED: uncharacterized protein LOC104230061 [Nicotiana sylvestris]
MTCIPLEVDVYKLSLDPNYPSVRQKKRLIAEVRNKFVKEEVTGLLNIDSIGSYQRYPRPANKREEGAKANRQVGDLKQVHHKILKQMPSLLLTSQKEVRLQIDPRMPTRIERPKKAVEISEFDIEYKPKTEIKSQVVADFMADLNPGLMPLATKEAVLVSKMTSGVWTLFTDGASNVKESGLGVVLVIHPGETLRLLLVLNGAGRKGIHSEVRKMSTPRTIDTPTSRTLAFSVVPMAIHEMGNGRSSTTRTQKGPYQKIGEREVVEFIWDHIICQFEIPKEIVCDNRPQFIGSKVTKFLEGLKIKRIKSSLYHPSANGQAESTNKVIIQNLKKKLEADKCKWPEELPCVLWAYQTTAKLSTGETPFSLVYGTKALIPIKVGEPTLWFSRANEEAKDKALLVKLDLLDEHRDLAYMRMVSQKQRMERYYNWRANMRYFKVGDLVLRKVT